ncbi:MAG: protein-S-isoprenylcysteine O-methyltransferase [Gammaproteobacteria bacterium]|nr:protein-S-isoprenylcysteine O-methyltransferase [Gammaproteobacteria bacterium]
MKTGIFDQVFVVCFVLIMLVRAAGVFYARMKNGSLKEIKLPPFGVDMVLELIQSLGLFFLPLIYLFSDWLDLANYTVPAVIGWSGLIIGLLSIWMLGRTHYDLGGGWSDHLEVKAGQALVTTGIYKRIRHPMYSAHLLYAIAQAMLLGNWIAGLSFLLLQLPFYPLRIPKEERMLQEHFGDAYLDYIQRTGRLLPRL